MTQRAKKLLLMAAGVWLVMTILAVSFGPVSIASLERRLEANAREALDRRGLNWAQVSMSGQTATVTGAAPDDDQREAAVAIVQASTWSGGVVAGGVTRVVDEMTSARLQRGFFIRADLVSNARVLVRGGAADDATRSEIVSFAQASFSNGANVDLILVPGGLAHPSWEDTVKRLLGQLARLEQGAIYVSGDSAALVGEAANPQIAQSVTRTLASLPEPYQGASLITPSGAPAEVSIANMAGCDAVIRAAHGTDDLRFDQDGVAPSPLTEVALRRMAEVFQACPDALRLRVEIGIAEGGRELAAARSERVQDLLISAGAAAGRLDVVLETNAVRLIQFEIENDEE